MKVPTWTSVWTPHVVSGRHAAVKASPGRSVSNSNVAGPQTVNLTPLGVSLDQVLIDRLVLDLVPYYCSPKDATIYRLY